MTEAIEALEPQAYVPTVGITRLQLPEYADAVGLAIGAAERELASRARATGRKLLDLTYADTHRFPPPDWALEALVHAAGGAGPTYTPYRGDATVLAEVASSVARFLGVPVDPERELILTPGTQAGLFAALAALVDVGTAVVLPDPDYITSERLIRFLGGQPVRTPLRHLPDGAHLDLDQLAEQIDEDARCILLSNPNNPTGAVHTGEVLVGIAELALRHDLFVIVDQLYSRLVYDGRRFVHFAALEGMKERTVTLLGPSKTESMSGFRIGVACGPPDVITAMEDVIGATVLRAPAYAQWMLVPWLRDDHDFVADRIRDYQALRDRTVAAFDDVDFIDLQAPHGTAYAFPSVRALGRSDQEVAACLIDAGMVVNPGYQFGTGGLGSFRICFAQDEHVWEDALSRIVQTLDSLRLRA
jgi:aspartate/methionine/tyrosine aminotransferase